MEMIMKYSAFATFALVSLSSEACARAETSSWPPMPRRIPRLTPWMRMARAVWGQQQALLGYARYNNSN